jgi:hypothetical protein
MRERLRSCLDLADEPLQPWRQRLLEQFGIHLAQGRTDPLPRFNLHISPEIIASPSVRHDNKLPLTPVFLSVTYHGALPAIGSLAGVWKQRFRLACVPRLQGNFLTYVNSPGETKTAAVGSAPITSESNLVEE